MPKFVLNSIVCAFLPIIKYFLPTLFCFLRQQFGFSFVYIIFIYINTNIFSIHFFSNSCCCSYTYKWVKNNIAFITTHI